MKFKNLNQIYSECSVEEVRKFYEEGYALTESEAAEEVRSDLAAVGENNFEKYLVANKGIEPVSAEGIYLSIIIKTNSGKYYVNDNYEYGLIELSVKDILDCAEGKEVFLVEYDD